MKGAILIDVVKGRLHSPLKDVCNSMLYAGVSIVWIRMSLLLTRMLVVSPLCVDLAWLLLPGSL